jgi:hypothetical protein
MNNATIPTKMSMEGHNRLPEIGDYLKKKKNEQKGNIHLIQRRKLSFNTSK